MHIGKDKPVAIELELSVKSLARIQSIINGYGGNLGVKEVWYYTDQMNVVRAIEKAAHGFPFIKVRQIPSSLPEKRKAG